jgi:hypothetical protein
MGSAPLLPFSSVPTHGRRRLKITTMKLRLGQGGNLVAPLRRSIFLFGRWQREVNKPRTTCKYPTIGALFSDAPSKAASTLIH